MHVVVRDFQDMEDCEDVFLVDDLILLDGLKVMEGVSTVVLYLTLSMVTFEQCC